MLLLWGRYRKSLVSGIIPFLTFAAIADKVVSLQKLFLAILEWVRLVDVGHQYFLVFGDRLESAEENLGPVKNDERIWVARMVRAASKRIKSDANWNQPWIGESEAVGNDLLEVSSPIVRHPPR